MGSSGAGSSVGLSPINNARTRSDLEKLLAIAQHSKEIKRELIDNEQSMDVDNHGTGMDYDDDVFFIGRTVSTGKATAGQDDIESYCLDLEASVRNASAHASASTNVAQPVPGTDSHHLDSHSLDMAYDLGRNYKLVRAAAKAASSRRQLNPNAGTREQVSTGSFVAPGDERILLTNMVHNTQAKETRTYSFDPTSRKCNTCPSGAHEALMQVGGGGGHSGDRPLFPRLHPGL